MNETISFRIDHGNSVRADGHDFRVPDLKGFSVGKPQFERLERMPIQPFTDCAGVHCFAIR